MKECKVCKKEFKAKRDNQIYCSAECRNIARKDKLAQYYKNHIDEIRARKKEYNTSDEYVDYYVTKTMQYLDMAEDIYGKKLY